ncbi:MAG: peptidylprolyl isomerase [Vicinamibacterales bacterium]
MAAAIAMAVQPGPAHVHAQSLGPIVQVETDRGRFTIMLFRDAAPVSVAHVLGLIKAGFYDGQRIHRAIEGFVVQFGDPQTRDPKARDRWGRGDAASSGSPIGISETSSTRKHGAFAVGLAHRGEPAKADSQLYITLAPRPDLDGKYAVVGQVVDGTDVLPMLRVGDQIRRVYISE